MKNAKLKYVGKIYRNKKLPILVGVYKITCLLGENKDKFYIGSSLKVFHRWELHKFQLENAHHHNYKLQKDFDLHGMAAFDFEVIWKAEKGEDVKIVFKKEQNFINKLKPFYNIEMIVGIRKEKKILNLPSRRRFEKISKEEILLDSKGRPISFKRKSRRKK